MLSWERRLQPLRDKLKKKAKRGADRGDRSPASISKPSKKVKSRYV